ncbi:TnsD family Tn7-like transposition protein [Paenibacillus sp. FSL R7-0297]|nr:Tn7-like transposition protein D [Paenibacillus sp. FSL R7-269]
MDITVLDSDSLNSEREVLNNLEQLIENSNDLQLEQIQMKFRNIIGLKGYLKYSGNVEQKKLIEDFNKYLIANSFNKFLPIDVDDQLNITTTILTGNRVKSILFYILFIMFLSGSVEKFLKDNSAFTVPIPFGNGPWLCHNSVCQGFNLEVIRKCVRVDRQGKFISGLFGCPLCGFSFVKRWRNTNQENDGNYVVLTMGPLWYALLTELHETGLSNTQIAKRLNTTATQVKRGLLSKNSTSGLDKRILQPLNQLWSSLGSDKEVASTLESTNNFNENRVRILKILKENEGISRTEMSKKYSYLYNKMKIEDNEWLESVLPPSKKNRTRLDWGRIDDQYCKDVTLAAEKVYKQDPPEQIKKYTILSYAPRTITKHLEQVCEKLPKTIKLLESKVETDEHYLIRHLPVIISQMTRYSKRIDSLDDIKTFSPMYRRSTKELDDKIKLQLNELS